MDKYFHKQRLKKTIKIMIKEKTIWDVLSSIDCSEFTEKKNGLTYLSWAHAWGYTKKNYPSANYEVILWDGKPYLYDEVLGYLVQTTVSIDGEKISMQLPVMDGANKAQKAEKYTYKTKYGEKEVEAATMFDINTAIMRCLTKNLAMFGLGHYIYAGEDMPESVEEIQSKQVPVKKAETSATIKPNVQQTELTPEELSTNLMIAKAEIKEAKSTRELLSIYERWSSLTKDKEFISAITKRKEELINVN